MNKAVKQHPFVSLQRGQDGNIQKTIEHYTFADSQSTATITVEADKARGEEPC